MKCLVINYRNTVFILGVIFLLSVTSFSTIMGMTIKSDNPIRRLPIYCVETDEKKIAITFDAAWSAEDTDEIIEILNEYLIQKTEKKSLLLKKRVSLYIDQNLWRRWQPATNKTTFFC